MPVVQALGPVVTGGLLDQEGKTVVRLIHRRPATLSGATERLPGRLGLIPVRGYSADLARAGRIIMNVGLERVDGSGYPAALEAAGVDPDHVPLPPVQAELPADVAVARVLLSFLDELDATHDGTVSDIDIEFLHEFRVAVRRSRAAVETARRRPAPWRRRLGDAAPEVAGRYHHADA